MVNIINEAGLFEVKTVDHPIEFVSPNIACVAVTFTTQEINVLDFQHYAIIPPARLMDMVEKRRCEYLAGRISAHIALERINIREEQVVRAESGCPIWPQGIIGSITHTDSLAISCVSRVENAVALGVDAEEILSDVLARELAPQLLTVQDKRCATLLPFNHFVTFIFSAKEAIYKALYPCVGVFFGFEAVSLVELNETVAVFEVQEHLSDQWQKGSIVKVNYVRTDSMIYSFVHF